MIKRVQEARLLELLGRFPVVAVIGPRQVGKSTLVQSESIGKGRSYFTLDDYDTLGLAEKDPRALLNAGSRVTIDEVQRCRPLLRGIKAEVDKDRVPGRFLVTGSANLNLTADLAQELAGRVGVLPLSPLSWRELEGRLARPLWLNWLGAENIEQIEAACDGLRVGGSGIPALFSGGYPPAVTAATPEARHDWFASYRFTYLERDVRQVANIGNLAEFARLFQTVAARSSKLMNMASLARDVGLNATTTGRYVSLLEATFQISRLVPWFVNIGKRLVKSPKIYWSDTGLLAHLLGLSATADVMASDYRGALVETFAVMEVLKHVEVFDPSLRVHFLRSHGGLEVDGLVVGGTRQLPFEIKASETARVDDAGNLEKYLTLSGGKSPGLVFYNGAECRRLSGRVLAVPLHALLL